MPKVPAGYSPPNRVVSGGLAPALGAVQIDDIGGDEHVEHDNDRLRDTEGFRLGDSHSEEPQSGLGRSIRPGVTVPATVLVVAMTDGSYLLVDHPQGESAAFIAVDDAYPMWQALTTAFGNPDNTPVNGNSSSQCTARGRL